MSDSVANEPRDEFETSVPVDEPILSGPSFLGLNKPSPGARAHGSSSRNLEYLLEDDEEPKSVAWKLILIAVALALVAGWGYLRWRNGGLPGLSSSKATSMTAPSRDAPDAGTASSASATGPTGTADNSASAPDHTSPSQPASTQPATTQSSSSTSGAGSSGSPDSAAGNAANPVKDPSAEDQSAAQPANPTDAQTSQEASRSTKDAAKAVPPAHESHAARRRRERLERAETAKAAAASRPTRSAAATKTIDAVGEGEKYVYGHGTSQDCDRGLKLLRTAGETNAKAMIDLGALYSTGVCAPRDLPTAYRWFALALRKDPNNDPLQETLKKLWAQMTTPERQLAIKLSQ